MVGKLRGNAATIGVTIMAGFGWILFGYDLGVLGGVLNEADFSHTFVLNDVLTGLTTGVFELAAMFGALGMAAFGQVNSRANNTMIGTGIIALGAVIQASSTTLAQLIVGRLIGGTGLGIFTSVCPLWQAEITPANRRGRVIGFSLSFLIVGLMLSYWIDYGMSKYVGSVSWRFPFAFQCILAGFNMILTRFVPESPRWLLKQGRTGEARQSLSMLFDAPEDDEKVEATFQEIEIAIEIENGNRYSLLDFLRGANDGVRGRRRVLTGCFFQLAQCFSGSTIISFYVQPIFQTSIGLTHELASLMSGYLQIWFLVASLMTWYFVERFGRRKMFMSMAAAMSVDMFLLAAFIKIDTKGTGIGAAVCVFLYQSFYTWGWMAGVWLMCTEIHSLGFRTVGGGLQAATQWAFNFATLFVFPIIVQNIGYKTWFIFACCNLAYVAVVYFFVPETRGLPLESIDLCFRPGVDPVKESQRLQQLVKEGRLEETTLVGDLRRRELEAKGHNEKFESVGGTVSTAHGVPPAALEV
ncbi:general substrate transporter [Kockovaella imperatae]|uniref:General substrate transporter n=1 Tax=Kockovaella imperatae TaxID=4999 RepID=A0A1Y1U732_9TREE|nr:general substrate transporter [Kockovaella imperatae]ORX33354.1 general substrate transporter [Kockovaella imperatae]